MSLKDLMLRALEDPDSISRLKDKIKKGSQGSVTGPFEYEGEKVALKMFDYTDRPDVKRAIRDFEREYQSLKVLTHPSIIRFIGFDHFPRDNKAYLRMAWASTELADLESGGAVDLGDIICHHDGLHSNRSKSFLPEAFIWHVLFHLSAALALCHHGIAVRREKVTAETYTQDILGKLTQTPPDHLRALSQKQPKITWTTEKLVFSVKSSHERIVHRDIKPRNVLVCDPVPNTDDGSWRKHVSLGAGDKLRVYPTILLGDFGLSAPLHVAQTIGIGSYGFTAPEVPKTYRPDGRHFEWKTSCDIFSLGATVWNLMSLQTPPVGFHDDDALPELPIHYSSALRTLILQCYSHDESKRPTAISLLDSCLQNRYWARTLVGPYGTLISSDFDESTQQTWRMCLEQLKIKFHHDAAADTSPALVDDILSFVKVEQTDQYGEFAPFIVGAYFVGGSFTVKATAPKLGRRPGPTDGKQNKRQVYDSDTESDEDTVPLHFFVPGEAINAAVLVEYLYQYVDRTAKITSAQHPSDKSRTGFNITAKRALNAVSIRDIINDSRDWETETQSREFRRNPYDYRESDTARRRYKSGPTPGFTPREVPQRNRSSLFVSSTYSSSLRGYRPYSSGSSVGNPATSNYHSSSQHASGPWRPNPPTQYQSENAPPPDVSPTRVSNGQGQIEKPAASRREPPPKSPGPVDVANSSQRHSNLIQGTLNSTSEDEKSTAREEKSTSREEVHARPKSPDIAQNAAPSSMASRDRSSPQPDRTHKNLPQASPKSSMPNIEAPQEPRRDTPKQPTTSGAPREPPSTASSFTAAVRMSTQPDSAHQDLSQISPKSSIPALERPPERPEAGVTEVPKPAEAPASPPSTAPSLPAAVLKPTPPAAVTEHPGTIPTTAKPWATIFPRRKSRWNPFSK